MALSKKHYIAIAKVLNKNAIEANTDAERGVVANITADLAEIFANDNPRFDMVRFINAALSGEGI